MKNLRIGAKLSLAFLLLIAALVALGGLSVYNQATLGASAADLGGRLAKLQKLTHSIDTQTSNFRAEEMTHIASTSPEEMALHEKAMGAARDAVDQMAADLETLHQEPAAAAAMRKFQVAWPRFKEHSEQTLALSRRNDNDAARASAVAEVPAYNIQNDALTEAETAYTAAMDKAVTQANSTAATGRAITLGVMLVVAAFAIAMLVVLIRSIAKPIAAVTGALSELAKGKMDAAVPVDDRRDEVGDLAKAMTGLRDQLAGAERAKQAQTALIVDSVGTGLSALAAGDLTARIDADLTGPFAKLKTDFNAAMDAMGNAIGTVTEAASGINSGAGDIRQASDDLSQRTEQQAASLEETAAAMDEITSTVRETAAGAAKANAAVSEARAEAEHSGEVVKRAVDAMGGIERSSAEISEIISVIDGIAFQTNLLALNAGVEAARAGDAGKGFAVVASEVRALAQRSAEAAKDVKTRITASGVQVEAGVELVSETGKALDRIIGRIAEIATLVATIAASAEQQATGLQQVNTAVNEMDGVTQQNAAMVEEATAAARSLATEAEALSREVSRFKLDGVAVARPVVHQLQERAADAGRRIARAAPRAAGNTALANDDWSEF